MNSGAWRRAGLHFEFLRAAVDTELTRPLQQDIADAILAKALDLVPVRTGALKRSGRTAITPNRKGVEVRFGNSRVAYARVVEFGRMATAPFPARPYLRPAVAMVTRRDKMRRIFKNRMRLVEAKHIPKVIL